MKTDAKTESLWQKTRHANLVRNLSSGKYFARFRHNGKLIWRGLDTDVLSIAAQRLPDKIKAVKDEQALLASGSDPRITFEAATKIYQKRIQASPDFKPRTKGHHEERLIAFERMYLEKCAANVRKDKSAYRKFVSGRRLTRVMDPRYGRRHFGSE